MENTFEAATEGNPQCGVCTIVTEIYGTSEGVVPWLCKCEEKSAAPSSLQQILVEVKPRRRIGRLLVPPIGAKLRKRWLDAQK